MAQETRIIKTGVDKLMDLLRIKRTMSIQDAAKELGFSPHLVEDWATFLEEENIINIEYRLTKPYLVYRGVTKEELGKKLREIKNTKDLLIRKAETMSASIEKESEKVKLVKELINSLKGKCAADIKEIASELKQFDRYTELKKGVDKQIMDDRKNYEARIKELGKDLLTKQKQYASLLKKISLEKSSIIKEKITTQSLEKSEKILRLRLNGLAEQLERANKKISHEKEIVATTKKHIEEVRDKANILTEDVRKKRKEITKQLEAKREEYDSKIKELQKRILNKISVKGPKKERIMNARQTQQKLKRFFKEYSLMEKLVHKIDADKQGLEKEIKDFINKTKMLDTAIKTGKLENYETELQTNLKKIKSKADVFKSRVKKVTRFLK